MNVLKDILTHLHTNTHICITTHIYVKSKWLSLFMALDVKLLYQRPKFWEYLCIGWTEESYMKISRSIEDYNVIKSVQGNGLIEIFKGKTFTKNIYYLK